MKIIKTMINFIEKLKLNKDKKIFRNINQEKKNQKKKHLTFIKNYIDNEDNKE